MLRGYLALKSVPQGSAAREVAGRAVVHGGVRHERAARTTALVSRAARREREGWRSSRISSLVIDRGNYYRNRPDANTEFYTGDGESRRRAHRPAQQRSVDRRLRAHPGRRRVLPHPAIRAGARQPDVRAAHERRRDRAADGRAAAVGARARLVSAAALHGRHIEGAGDRAGERHALPHPRTRAEWLSHAGPHATRRCCSSRDRRSRAARRGADSCQGETGALARRQQGATALGVRVSRHRDRYDEGVRTSTRSASRRPTCRRSSSSERRAGCAARSSRADAT